MDSTFIGDLEITEDLNIILMENRLHWSCTLCIITGTVHDTFFVFERIMHINTHSVKDQVEYRRLRQRMKPKISCMTQKIPALITLKLESLVFFSKYLRMIIPHLMTYFLFWSNSNIHWLSGIMTIVSNRVSCWTNHWIWTILFHSVRILVIMDTFLMKAV